MSEIDQQFIEYVVKSLVGKPDAVQIERRIDEKGVLLELTVDPEDLGRVIGKRGATAQSLRTLLRALGTKNEARYNLKIIDNGDPEHKRPPRDDTQQQAPKDDSQSDNSDVTKDAAEEPANAEAPAPTKQEELVPEESPAEAAASGKDEEEQTSDRLRKAREELSNLDDLDI